MQVDLRAGRAAPVRQGSNAYLMTWVAVAAFGLGYIGVAATRPDLLGAILPIIEQPQDQVVAGRTSSDITDELAAMRKWVHDLQHELAAAKSTLQDQVAQSSAISQRLAAAEERLGPVREIRNEPANTKATVQRLQNRAQAPAGQPQQQSNTAAAEPGPRQATPAAQPADGANSFSHSTRVVSAISTPIATGSVPDVPAQPAGQTVAAAAVPQAKTAPVVTGPRAIEIGNSELLEGLRAKWGELSGRNAEVLGELAPRYRLAADGRQAPFTLLAGPFETPADAARTCTALRAKGVACRVGAYGGNTF